MITLPKALKYIKQYILPHQTRVSLFSQGSATLEAILLFPFILCFVFFFTWIIQAVYIHSVVGANLYCIGSEMVAASYVYNDLYDSDAHSFLQTISDVYLEEGYVKDRILSLNVSKRMENVTTLLGAIEHDDSINIVVTYQVAPIFPIPKVRPLILTNHFYSKAYVGYDGKDRNREEYVYITKTGTVYHTSNQCRGLKCTINETSLDTVFSMHNEEGALYYPCEKCSKYGFSKTV